MSIPDFQSLMLPFLQHLEDGADHSNAEISEHLAKYFKLTEADLKELLPSGRQSYFSNRVQWARTYLNKAGLIDYPQKGLSKITPRGREVLAEKLDKISVKYLQKYPEMLDFYTSKKDLSKKAEPVIEEMNPEEALEISYQQIRQGLAANLLTNVKSCSPAFFERMVVELLVAMGYGGSRKDAGEAIGQSGDEGIDGIIKEDRLGLDIIYIQAKRWSGTVGRPEIQKFAGALMGKGAKKGISITTSSFTKEAMEYARIIDTRIILIDGEQMANLMIDFGVGVTTVNTYEIKKIDTDYFLDE